MQTAFDQLPLACVVGGHILCVHGGVGDGRWDLNDLRAVRRPLGQPDGPGNNGFLLDRKPGETYWIEFV